MPKDGAEMTRANDEQGRCMKGDPTPRVSGVNCRKSDVFSKYAQGIANSEEEIPWKRVGFSGLRIMGCWRRNEPLFVVRHC
jgi:hypothetical protein